MQPTLTDQFGDGGVLNESRSVAGVSPECHSEPCVHAYRHTDASDKSTQEGTLDLFNLRGGKNEKKRGGGGGGRDANVPLIVLFFE